MEKELRVSCLECYWRGDEDELHGEAKLCPTCHGDEIDFFYAEDEIFDLEDGTSEELDDM